MRRAFQIFVWVFAGAFALELAVGGALTGFYFWYKAARTPPSPYTVVKLSPPKTAAEREAYNLAVFDKAWSDIDQLYYDRTFRALDWRAVRDETRPLAAKAKDSFDLYWKVLVPMAARLNDSHTNVLPAATPIARRNCTVHGEGTPGLVIAETRNRGLVISKIRKGSAAELAGIEPDWTFRNARIDSACGAASSVDFELQSSDGAIHKIHYEVKPLPPEPERVSVLLPSGVLLLRFNAFNQANIDWTITQLRHAPAAGVVLDLRDNSGGLGYDRLASALLPANKPLGHFVTASGIIHVKTSGAQVYRGPLAVLIGPGSASAAEITADVLRYNRRAVLAGRLTSGSVMAGGFYPLPDGGQVQVTTEAYLDPAYRSLEDWGVKPDVEVHQTLAGVRGGRDADVDTAIAVLDAERKACSGSYCPTAAAKRIVEAAQKPAHK